MCTDRCATQSSTILVYARQFVRTVHQRKLKRRITARMAESIASIRRRRLERFATDSLATEPSQEGSAAAVSAALESRPERGAMTNSVDVVHREDTASMVIPSEFECILCLR